MFYQVNLLKKKGQFGVVWLAAHYPTRLTKHDIITFDLENKCKELLEFTSNGQHNRPKFSIKLSSYLMYGLVVILQRKINYYNNDLVAINALLKPATAMAALKAQEKSARKTPAKKRVTINKSALEIKENIPEDLTFDLTFKMPEERDYDLAIPFNRIRDITLPETEIEQFNLMHPIPMVMDEFELPVPPSQFLFQSDDINQHFLQTTSTAKKPTDRRVPFQELDSNRDLLHPLHDQHENTFQVLERLTENAARGLASITNEQTVVDMAFDAHEGAITQVEQTPFQKEREKEKEPRDAFGIEIIRTKKVLKRKNLIDKTISIDDKEMKKQLKHESKRPKLAMLSSVKSELMFLDHFKLTNQEVFRPPVLLLPNHLKNLNVMNRILNFTRYSVFNKKSQFDETLLETEQNMTDFLTRQDEANEDITRGREARSSLMQRARDSVLPAPEKSQAKLDERKTMEKGVSIQQINLESQNETAQPIQQTFFDQFAQPEQPQFLHEPGELISLLEPEQPRILNSKEDNVLNDIKNGKLFFHSLAPTSTMKRKDAASIFSIILRLSANKIITPYQANAYEDIELRLVD